MTDTVVPLGTGSSNIALNDGDTVSVYGTVTGTTVGNGGTETVYAGGVASFTTVYSGGFDVLSGGTALSAAVDTGGQQIVSGGGIASATTLNPGGEQTVWSGGASISAFADGGGTFFGAGVSLLAGGTATGATVTNGGYLEAGSYGVPGGTAISTTVDANGIAAAYAGGTLISTTVDSGGFERLTGGTASFTTFSSGGGGEADFGGTAVSGTLSGGYFRVFSGGVASGTVVDGNGGSFGVGSGGAAIDTTVNSGGFMAVSGGTASFTTISSAGQMNVFSGGRADRTIVDSGGTEFVGSGGIDSGAILSGGILLLDGGLEFVTIGGFQQVSAGVASGTMVDAFGYQVVSSGGVAVSTTIDDQGTQSIGAGGTANATTIASGGQQFVTSGGIADFVTIASGGQQIVSSGGSAGFVTISAGGTEYVGSGGTASGVLVSGNITILFSSGDTFYFAGDTGFQVVSGGSAVDTMVDPGGQYFDAVQVLTAGGAATGTVVVSSGFVVVSSGGVASFTIVSGGGTVFVTSGGSAVDTVVLRGGIEIATGNGGASGTIVSSGGAAFASNGGVLLGTTVDNGGSAVVSSGGTAGFTTISGGGYQIVSSGGLASATAVSSGGTQIVSSGGVASSTTISGGGAETVLTGGLASGSVVDGGGIQSAGTGGVTIGTTLSDGGREAVSFGLASATTISSGGIETIASGGLATGTTILDGGEEIAGSGGSAGFAGIGGGGSAVVLGGGVDFATTISGGGLEIVSSGGLASAGMVLYAGAEFVSAGGSAVSVSVAAGGGEFVFSGGDAEATAVSAGGFVVVLPGGVANGTTGPGVTVSTGIVVWSLNSGTSAYGDAPANLTVSDGDIAFVLPGGSAVAATVGDGGTLDIYLGGFAGAVTVSGGALNVSSGGTASGTVVTGGGVETVFAGAAVLSTTVFGTEIVASGATVSFTTVSVGGDEQVLSGGDTLSATIGAFGLQQVNSGASATLTTVTSGGAEYVYAGGVTFSTMVGSAGTEAVSSGGIASQTTVASGGTEAVFSGGSAISSTIDPGGTLLVLPGGTRSGTMGGGAVVSAGVVLDRPGSGFAYLGAVASGVAVTAGATEYVLTGGIAVGGTVASGGEALAFSGGVLSGTALDGTGVLSSGGTASAVMTDSGGLLTVSSGGAAIAVVVSGGGVTLSSGGTATGTALEAAGILTVSSGGTAQYTTVSGGGGLTVLSGGLTVSATVGGGGTETVSSGGVASATTLDGGTDLISGAILSHVVSGGAEDVLSGGTASGTSIGTGGAQTLFGGVAVSAIVNSGGTQAVSAGGLANATTVQAGGTVIVSAGGSAAYAAVSAGGVLLYAASETFGDTTIDGGWTIGAGATITIAPHTTTYVGQQGDHLTTLTVAPTGALDVLGTLDLDGTIDGGTVRLRGTIDGGTIEGGTLEADGGGTVTLDNVTLLSTLTVVPGTTLKLEGDDQIGGSAFGTTDLGGGTIELTGSLSLGAITLGGGTLDLGAGAEFNPGGESSIGGLNIGGLAPASGLGALSGQNVTLTAGTTIQAGETVAVQTGTGGTPGTFTIAGGVDVVGAGTILVADANGDSSAVVNGILIANQSGQTLHIDAGAISIDPAVEAVNGGTLELGDTNTAASGDTTLSGGPYVVGADSTLLLDNLGSIITIEGAIVTLDGTNATLAANAGGDLVPLEQTLGTIGGGSFGTLNLLNGEDFQAQNDITLVSGTITLNDAILAAPSVTGTVYVNGGGVVSPVISGNGTVSSEIDGVGMTVAANGGTLELSGAVASSALLEAMSNASLVLDQALPTQDINAGPYDSLKLLNNATITMADASVAPGGGITFAGTASTVDLTNVMGETFAVSGATLTNDAIDLLGVTAATDNSGNPEIQITRKSSTLEQVVITLASGNPDEFDITGNFTGTGVTAGDDGNGGTVIQFAPPPDPATPYVITGNGLTLEPGGEFEFGTKVHQLLPDEDEEDEPVATLLITNGYATNSLQGTLSGSVGGTGGALTAEGSFKGLQPGQNTNDLPQVDGEPAGIAVSLNTVDGGLVTGTVTLQFTSTAPASSGSKTKAQASQLPDQTVTVQEKVYDYANPVFPTTVFYIRASDEPGTQTLHLPIANDVPDDGYSEGLIATITGATGNLFGDEDIPVPSGTTPLVPAGATNSTDLTFTVDNDVNDFPDGRAAEQTGFIDVQVTSDGDGTSELGNTDEGTEPVPVSVFFTQLATAYALMPQNFWINATTGAGSQKLAVTIANIAEAGVSENLIATVVGFTGDLAAFGGNYQLNGESVTVAAGQADQSGLSFLADTNYSDAGNIYSSETGTMILDVRSTGAGTDGAAPTDLGELDVPINVYFNGPAQPYIETQYYTHATAPNASHPSTTTLDIAVSNITPKNSHSDNLIATLTGSTGDFSESGNANITANPAGTTAAITPASTDTSSIAFQVVTDANAGAANQTGQFSFSFTNVPPGGPNLSQQLGDLFGGIPPETLGINVQVLAYASPVIEGLADPVAQYSPAPGAALHETINLGTIPVGYYIDHIVNFSNVAVAPADSLGIIENQFQYGVITNSTTLIGPGTTNNAIAPGQSFAYDGFVAQAVAIDNVLQLGTNSQLVQYVPLSENPTSTTTLTPVDVIYTWVVVKPRATADAWGDVHITTFDGSTYNFQAEGEFVLAQSTQPGNSFQIQVRLQPLSSAPVTLITDLALRIGTDTVSFETGRDTLMYVNGVASAINSNNALIRLSGGTVTLVNGTYTVAWNTGETMELTDSGTYLNVASLTLGANDGANSVQGLLGPANGGANDFQLANGTYLATNDSGQVSQSDIYGAFASSWRVTDETSLLDYGNGQTTATFTDPNFPADADAVSLDDLPTSVQTAALAAAAAAGITDPVIQQQAALDFALTGSNSFLFSGANAQQQTGGTTAADVEETPPPTPALGVSAVANTVTEAASGQTMLSYTVYLTEAATAATTVDYAVTVPGAGYLGAAAFGGTLPGGSVQIAIGDTSATFQVAVDQGALGTDVTDAVQVTISSPDSAPIVAASAQTTVINSSPVAGPPAVAEVALLSGLASVVRNGTTLQVALGNVIQGEQIDPLQFQISNGAAAGSDNLAGTLTDSELPAFTALGTATLDPLAPGTFYQGLDAEVSTGTIGAGADTIVYSPTDVNETGWSATLAAQSIALSDTVLAPAAEDLETPGPFSFAPVHVGGSVAPVVLTVANTASSGAADLDASLTIAEGGFTAAGTVSLLAPSTTDDSSLSIGEADSTAGAYSGAATIGFVSDGGDGYTLALSPETIDLSGSVYRLASAGLAPLYLHAGGSGDVALPIVNSAAVDGYSEALTGSVVSTSGGITTSGSIGTIAAGATSTSLGLIVPTSVAGSGTVTLGMVSDGIGIDGLGTTGLSDTAVPVFIDNYATAAFSEVAGGGVLNQNGTAATLDLGVLALGSGPHAVSLDVSNAATGQADQLSGQFAVTGDTAFANSGTGAFSGINAGSIGATPQISLATAQTGTFSETITLSPTGSNAGGYSAALSEQTFTLTGTVLAAPTVTQLAPTPSSGDVGAGQTITIAVSFSDAVTVDGTPTLSLNDGGAANYVSGSGSGTLLFSTVVEPGENAPELAATSLNLGDGNSIVDASSGLPVDLSGFDGALTGVVTVDGGTPPCFAAGTRIATPDGDVAVEALAIGDRVVLRDGAIGTVVWIGYRRVDCTRHPDPLLIQPIRVRAGAFADGAPGRDLLVSPDHALFFDGLLIPARLLLNGGSIVRETGCRAVTYYHVELERHAVLLAEGLPAESYLDTGNRAMFENSGLPLPLHANFGDGETGQVARVSGACAPFADEPAVVEPVWRMLAERARVLGMHSPAASERMDDPDLHLRVGERRLDPVRVAGNRYTFVIPAMEAPVRLTSRVARPCDLQPWLIDVRRLGVMVRALRVRHDRDVRDLVLDDPRLARGWWRAERQDGRPVRWTNGSAALPVAGPCVLEVELACSMHYAIDGAAPAAVAAA